MAALDRYIPSEYGVGVPRDCNPTFATNTYECSLISQKWANNVIYKWIHLRLSV